MRARQQACPRSRLAHRRPRSPSPVSIARARRRDLATLENVADQRSPVELVRRPRRDLGARGAHCETMVGCGGPAASSPCSSRATHRRRPRVGRVATAGSVRRHSSAETARAWPTATPPSTRPPATPPPSTHQRATLPPMQRRAPRPTLPVPGQPLPVPRRPDASDLERRRGGLRERRRWHAPRGGRHHGRGRGRRRADRCVDLVRAHRPQGRGNTRWVTGATPTYTNFGGAGNTSPYDCSGIYQSKWAWGDCTTLIPYVCECDGMAAQPTAY